MLLRSIYNDEDVVVYEIRDAATRSKENQTSHLGMDISAGTFDWVHYVLRVERQKVLPIIQSVVASHTQQAQQQSTIRFPSHIKTKFNFRALSSLSLLYVLVGPTIK